MDARPEKVNHFTGGSNVYQIPVFQRAYEWDKEKWFYLWQDIRALYDSAKFNLRQDPLLGLESALRKTTHFIGILLTRAVSPLGGGMGQRYVVVDGQQRLITLFIILSAIRDSEVASGAITEDDPLSTLAGRDRKFPRFTINHVDKAIFNKIVSGKCSHGMTETDSKSLVGQAYLFYRWQLWRGESWRLGQDEAVKESLPPNSRKKDSPHSGEFVKAWTPEVRGIPYDLELLQNCINYGLSLLELILGPDDEDDAIIFETINARGTELTKFDLIRNSFFLRLGESAGTFFETEWVTFESRLRKIQRPKRARGDIFDAFVYDYFVYSGTEKVAVKNLYSTWALKVREEIGALGDDKDGAYFRMHVAEPMLKASLLYPAAWGSSTRVQLEPASKNLPAEAAAAMKEILELSKGPTVPLHMLALKLFLEEKIDSRELVKWLRRIQGWILRMVIADESLNNLRSAVMNATPRLSRNPTFENLGKVLGLGIKNSDSYLKNVVASSPFANDQNAPAVIQILRGIERQMRKDVAHPLNSGVGESDWQVEHIYPQSPNGPGREWESDLKNWGFKQGNYEPLKFTLGNIAALTGLGNKTAGQKAFKEKKELFKKSHLGVNEELLEISEWSPKVIQERSKTLLSYFLSEWPEK